MGLVLPYDVCRYRCATLWFRLDDGAWLPLYTSQAGGLNIRWDREVWETIGIPEHDDETDWREIWRESIRLLADQGRSPAVVLLPRPPSGLHVITYSPEVVPEFTFRGPELRVLL